MTIAIKAGLLQAKIAEKGAELQSLKNLDTKIEYIWQADPQHWGKHAPILFPIVGALKNNQYRVDGVTYHLPRHGFARDMLFRLVDQKENTASFVLESTKETKQQYPYDFQLLVTYILDEEGLQVIYEVNNLSRNEMYFSIGGHPAFNVPFEPNLSFDDFYLDFSPKKSRIILPLAGNYVDLDQRTLGQTNTNVTLSRELFANDAIIYETKGQNSFSIRSDKSEHSVTLSYEDMSYVGFWTTYPIVSDFLCIEPWCGIADTTEATGELSEKLGIQRLEENQQFQTSYKIIVE